MLDLSAIAKVTRQVIDELQQVARLDADQMLVIGASSSEVIGEKIGSAGSTEVAKAIVEAVLTARNEYGFHVAFQCCEHLNRALVVERATMKAFGLEEVTVVPVPQAGGAVAATAFRSLQDPVLVERIQAHAGIDIGDTLIGMHLRPVAVPVRPTVKSIGQAHVTMARTRPKLIGGARAVYILQEVPEKDSD
ncbi:TIGR01440 family protein [Effusibacillus pohliae]|uniref:TIGR01440 family protein n=1 Tax=Effusibacillus pohliae TaxID=232270 RepID=UPI00035EF40F|nr:TIGR01440 family protein [Effusibacillus pohliae]